MKTMSQCLRISDCAETLEEARGVIDRMESRAREVAKENIAMRDALVELEDVSRNRTTTRQMLRDRIQAILANYIICNSHENSRKP
jgi:hypothetical protein